MYNQINLIGNLGADPQLRNTPTGRQVASFNVATNRNYQRNGEWESDTTWFRINVWGDAAERIATRLRKGHRVFVTGRLSTSQFLREDGSEGFSLEVNAHTTLPLDRLSDEEYNAMQSNGYTPNPPTSESVSVEPAAPAPDVSNLPW